MRTGALRSEKERRKCRLGARACLYRALSATSTVELRRERLQLMEHLRAVRCARGSVRFDALCVTALEWIRYSSGRAQRRLHLSRQTGGQCLIRRVSRTDPFTDAYSEVLGCAHSERFGGGCTTLVIRGRGAEGCASAIVDIFKAAKRNGERSLVAFQVKVHIRHGAACALHAVALQSAPEAVHGHPHHPRHPHAASN